MINVITESSEYGFEWLDAENPSDEEIDELTRKYALHHSSVKDWRQPDHLPKFENVGGYAFIIFRVHAEEVTREADTVPELTDSVSIFMNEERIITLHRKPWPAPEIIRKSQKEQNTCSNTHELANEIIKICLATYEEPSIKLTSDIEYYEANMFLKNRKPDMLKGLYYLRRRVEVTRRVIMLSHDIVEKMDTPEQGNANTRDTRDLFVKLQNIYDTLFENMNQLVMIYFSISSQRTNEIVRILTLFSVFFMPLTFIVGIYGMNFRYMPELQMKYGYPVTMFAMGLITVGIFTWFKHKSWL